MKFKKSNYANEDAGRESAVISDDQINKIVNIVYDRVMKNINNSKADNTKSSENLSSTKKKVIDLELYGVICICNNFNNPNNSGYYEGFKHALYDNMCHFHKTVNTYEDFDEMKYIINKYIKYEQMKNPGANIFDIYLVFLDNIINAYKYTSLFVFAEESKNINDNKRVLNEIIFSFARDKLSKDESRILDYDFSDFFNTSYLSEIGYVMKWTLKSTRDEYVKKYMPKRLNNTGNSSEENTIETINNIRDSSIKD